MKFSLQFKKGLFTANLKLSPQKWILGRIILFFEGVYAITCINFNERGVLLNKKFN